MEGLSALICGNGVVLKRAEDTPASAWFMAKVAQDTGLPAGVLNVVQGLGAEVDLHSWSIVTSTWFRLRGRRASTEISRSARPATLKKVSLKLGGKNALVVCDDADLDRAVEWILASAFSNAGQRCASASRVVVFDAVYEELRSRLVAAVGALEPQPVISRESMERILDALGQARDDGATVLVGGTRLERTGWHLAPTLVENVSQDAEISRQELFGPVTILYRVADLDAAFDLVNDSPYGLTAAIHTASVHRAMRFAERVQAGVVVVNAGTHGSEPHMGFGGVKDSGTGWREAGIEALDVYSDQKVVNLVVDPSKV